MSAGENRAKARRYFEEVFNRGNLAAVDELLAPSYFQRSLHFGAASPHMSGPGSIKKQAARLRATYPDFQYEIEKIVAEGDTVVVSGNVRGTYTGTLGSTPPEGRPLSYASIHVLRFEDGKIVEDWNLWDSLGWWQQLGVVPENPQLYNRDSRERRRP